MNSGIRRLIVESSELAQRLILDLFDSEPENRTFEQAGITDGHETVLGFISVGEQGCALSHLLYMVHESDIAFPRATMLQLHELADTIGLENFYSKGNQENLSREQRDAIFNAP